MTLKATLLIRSLVFLGLTGAMQLAVAQPTSDGLVAGRDYTLISPAQPISTNPGQVQVAEVFMYGCPHCFEFEPHWEAWKKNKADYIEAIRLPTSWGGLAQIHARAYYTEQVLGVLDKMNEDFFDAFHIKHNRLNTPEKIQAFFEKHGVSADKFKNAFDSFAVHTKVKRAAELVQRYKVTGTPSIVVAGKYLTTGQMAGSYDHWFEIINKLAAREHQAAQQSPQS